MGKQLKLRLTGWQSFGIGGMALALLVPATLWLSLVVATTPPNYCSECALGWYAVISVFLAVPVFLTSMVITIVATVVSLRAKAK